MIPHSSSASSARHLRKIGRQLVLSGVLFGSAPARAQGEAEQPAARAERLFREGREALKEERYELACAKLAESEALEAAAGTLLNWAICLEKLQRRVAAWNTYRAALDLARSTNNKDAARLARQQLGVLEGELVRLTIVPPLEPAPGLRILLDAVLLQPERWNQPLAMEPGEHVIEASAPGQKPWSQKLVALQAGLERVIVVPAPPLVCPLAKPMTQPHRIEPRAVANDGFFRTSWLVPGAVALAGLAATTYFGLRAASEWSTRQTHCRVQGCDAIALRASERAADFARLADVSAAVTLTAAATSVWLGVSFSRERSEVPKTPRMSFDTLVQARGTF